MENQENSLERKETQQEKLARMHGGASGRKFEFAKEQRRKSTETENLLWTELRGKKLGGYKFRRQHPFGRFVLDFFCSYGKLSVEIDGEIHNTAENIEYDKTRTKILQDNGITEMRFSNQEILDNREDVLKRILLKLNELKKEWKAENT